MHFRRPLSPCPFGLAVAGLFACTLVPRIAHADRPFDGTDADVTELGVIEFEIGPVAGERVKGATTYTPELEFDYGFLSGFELVVDADGNIPLGNAAGRTQLVSDILVKHVLRAGVLQDHGGPSLAIETGLLLPGLPAYGHDTAGWALALIASYRFAPITVHLNVKGEYDLERALSAMASVMLEGPDAWPVRPVIEALVARDGGQDQQRSVLAGAIWQLQPSFSVDAAIRTCREPGLTWFELRAGLTWTFSISHAS